MDINNFNDLSKYVEGHTVDQMVIVPLRNQAIIYSCDMETISDVGQMVTALNNATKGKFTITLGDTIQAEVTDIKNNFNRYKTLYCTMLEDEKSKDVLFNILAFRLTRMEKYILNAFCYDSEQYFDPAVALYKEDCVYADCGALDGYTTAKFMLHCPSYKKIYLYEPMECYYADCVENVNSFCAENIVLRKAAVFDKNTTLKFNANVTGNSKADENGDITVNSVSLDEDINEPLGFIKMDIEGSEKQALRGAEQHIKNDTPMLAICVYHLPADLWEIPFMIQKMNGNYGFQLRHHQFSSDETVIYALQKGYKEVAGFHTSAISKETELACRKFVDSLEQKENQALRLSKKYLQGQVENYQFSMHDIMRSNNEFQNWSAQLNEAKEYLANEVQKRDDAIKELQNWAGQLEEAKTYLSGELSNRDEKLASCTKKIDEQQQTIEQLTNQLSKLRFYLKEEINKPWHKKLLHKSRENDYKL